MLDESIKRAKKTRKLAEAIPQKQSPNARPESVVVADEAMCTEEDIS